MSFKSFMLWAVISLLVLLAILLLPSCAYSHSDATDYETTPRKQGWRYGFRIGFFTEADKLKQEKDIDVNLKQHPAPTK